MAILSDNIEEFLVTLINGEKDPVIMVQRNELANYFRCAPSQINYVLATRFTLERGYNVESRRGGGGYIRIIKLKLDRNDYLSDLIETGIGDEMTESDAQTALKRLFDEEIITEREYKLTNALVSDRTLAVPSPIRERIRANLFRQMAVQWIK